MATPNSPIASAHLPLQRARFFLGKAQATTDVDRVELDHYLTAAVVSVAQRFTTWRRPPS